MDEFESRDSGDVSEIARFTRRVGIVIAIVTLTGLVLLLGYAALPVFLLVFASILWAVLLRGVGDLVARRLHLPDWLAVGLVLLALLGASAGLGVAVAPEVMAESRRVADMLPRAIDAFRRWLESSPFSGLLPELPRPETVLGHGRAAWSNITGVFQGALGMVGNTVLVLAVGVYFAFDPERYRRGFVRLVPLGYRDRAREVFDHIGTQLGWWLGGRFLSMAIVGVSTTVGLLLLGVPLAFFLGYLSGLLSFVPVVGPIVASIPAALLALLQGPDYMLYVLLLYAGIQALENYVLVPVIGQHVVDLPPALLVLAQVLLGLLTGFLGVLLASPLMVVATVVVGECYVRDVLGDAVHE
jgi:predicted PurR-regulated permease PerM